MVKLEEEGRRKEEKRKEEKAIAGPNKE